MSNKKIIQASEDTLYNIKLLLNIQMFRLSEVEISYKNFIKNADYPNAIVDLYEKAEERYLTKIDAYRTDIFKLQSAYDTINKSFIKVVDK